MARSLPKANRYVRKLLTQAAHAAVKKKGSNFQSLFRRLLTRLGYKGAIWAIAHRLGKLAWKILHDGVSYIEQGEETNPKASDAGPRNSLKLSANSAMLSRSAPSFPSHSPSFRGSFQESGCDELRLKNDCGRDL
jgi:hypothetical protein